MKISEIKAENEKLKNMLEEKGVKIDNSNEKLRRIQVENTYLKEQLEKKKEVNKKLEKEKEEMTKKKNELETENKLIDNKYNVLLVNYNELEKKSREDYNQLVAKYNQLVELSANKRIDVYEYTTSLGSSVDTHVQGEGYGGKYVYNYAYPRCKVKF